MALWFSAANSSGKAGPEGYEKRAGLILLFCLRAASLPFSYRPSCTWTLLDIEFPALMKLLLLCALLNPLFLVEY